MAIRKSQGKKREPRRVRAVRKAPARPIWEIIVELGERIPPEELANFPTDGAQNLHHYLHGHPKQDPD